MSFNTGKMSFPLLSTASSLLIQAFKNMTQLESIHFPEICFFSVYEGLLYMCLRGELKGDTYFVIACTD